MSSHDRSRTIPSLHGPHTFFPPSALGSDCRIFGIRHPNRDVFPALHLPQPQRQMPTAATPALEANLYFPCTCTRKVDRNHPCRGRPPCLPWFSGNQRGLSFQFRNPSRDGYLVGDAVSPLLHLLTEDGEMWYRNKGWNQKVVQQSTKGVLWYGAIGLLWWYHEA